MQLLVVPASTLPIYLPFNVAPAEFGEPFTDVTFNSASANVTVPGYGEIAQVNDAVMFTTTGALPSTLTVGTVYYVVSGGSGSNINISATVGGSAITVGNSGASGTATLHVISTWQGIPLPFKPGNTVLAVNLTSTATNLQGAADANTSTYGDPQGPGSFTTIVAVPNPGMVLATLSYDWIQSSGAVAINLIQD